MHPRKSSNKELKESEMEKKGKGQNEEIGERKSARQDQPSVPQAKLIDEERKERERERKKRARAVETEEAKAARLAYQREYYAKTRELSEEQGQKESDRKKKARAKETEEAKAARLAYQRQYYSREIEEMTDSERKQMLKQKRGDQTKRREKAEGKVLTIEEASLNFQKKCTDLPEFVCTVCHRLLWRRSVVLLKESNYNFESDIVKRCLAAEYRKETRPDQSYMCTTCHNDLKRKKPLMPAQAVANGLQLPPLPNLPPPNDLERRLFSLACPFMKIGGLPRGGQYRLQGPCINVPTNLETVCDFLPRLPDEAGVILLKFKRKLSYKGHYMYDTVRPPVVLAWLQWLKENNPLYEDVEVRSNWNQLLSGYEENGK